MILFCAKKGCEAAEPPQKLELHHLIPKSILGTDIDGRRYVCKKHHDIICQLIIPILFSYVPNEKKEMAKAHIKEYTIEWLKR